MSDNIKLSAEIREEIGKKSKHLIADQKKIRAVIYGPKFKNKNLILNYNDFKKVFSTAGRSTMVSLNIGEDKPIKVIIHKVDVDPVSSKYSHVDFYKLDTNKALKVEVALNFIGEAPAVKLHGGEIVKSLDKIEIECLPDDLVKQVDVNLNVLENTGDRLAAGDIKLPENIKLATAPDVAVVAVEEIKEIVEEVKPEETAEKEESAEDKKEDASGDGDKKTPEKEDKK